MRCRKCSRIHSCLLHTCLVRCFLFLLVNTQTLLFVSPDNFPYHNKFSLLLSELSCMLCPCTPLYLSYTGWHQLYTLHSIHSTTFSAPASNVSTIFTVSCLLEFESTSCSQFCKVCLFHYGFASYRTTIIYECTSWRQKVCHHKLKHWPHMPCNVHLQSKVTGTSRTLVHVFFYKQ